MKALKFLVLFFLPFTALAEPSLPLSLISYSGDQTNWTLKFQFEIKDSCKVVGKIIGAKESQTHVIDPAECRSLRKDFEGLKTEIAKHEVNLKKPVPSATESGGYQFELGSVKFYLHAVEPADCRMNLDGKMECAQNELSGSQRLLHRLLDYAQVMKLGSSPRQK